MDYGIVEAIDRTTGTVRGRFSTGGSGSFDDVAYLGPPPAPMSRVAIDNSGGLRTVVGQLGQKEHRVVFHDDFLIVDSVFGYGETPWRGAGTVGTINTSSGLDAIGHVRIRGNPTSGQEVWLTKNDGNITLSDSLATWFSARFMPQQVTNARYRMGLANDLAANDASPAGGIAGGAAVYLSLDTSRSSAFEAIVSTGTSVSLLDLPHTFAAQFYIIDIVALGDQFAAFWVDGDGPYLVQSATDVPGPADPGVNPILYVEALEAVAKIMFVDWVHIEQFVPAGMPTALGGIEAVA